MMIFGKNAGGERTVGIMTTPAEYTPPFENRGFYRRLCLLGPRLHLSVYVFTPNSVDWEQERVTGYTYEASAGQWSPARSPCRPSSTTAASSRRGASMRTTARRWGGCSGIRTSGCSAAA